jgi:molybdenum cofactor cytidylyltransferase
MTSYAIVPAAGRSRRMGAPKLLLPWGETTLIERVLGAWRASRVDQIAVVVHPNDQELIERCQGERVTVVRPVVPPPEMKDSVAAALRHIEAARPPGPDDCWLLAPADLPNLSTATIDRLLVAYHAQPKASRVILVPVHNDQHGGRRGHPVLFPWPLASEVFALAAAEGVNQLLRRHAVLEVACGAEAIGEDVDTLEDYRRMASPRRATETRKGQSNG